MNNPLAVIFGIVVAVIAGLIVLGIVGGIVHFLLQLIIPVLVLVGAGYVLHAIFVQKSIGGGSRRTLL